MFNFFIKPMCIVAAPMSFAKSVATTRPTHWWLRAIKRFKFLESTCWCMGGESQYPSKFTHEKVFKNNAFRFAPSSFKQNTKYIISILLIDQSFKNIFKKRHACGTVYAADCEIFCLKLGLFTIRYIGENIW